MKSSNSGLSAYLFLLVL